MKEAGALPGPAAMQEVIASTSVPKVLKYAAIENQYAD